MERKKSFLFKFITICMLLCFAFISVGCLGMPGNPDGFESDDDGDFDDDDFQDSIIVDMYGTKVLFRPDDYDYNYGSGAETGETNNYYGKYAYFIMEYLFNTYGWFRDYSTISQALPNFNIEEDDRPWGMNMTSYLYDSIRYQVDTLAEVDQFMYVTVNANGEITGSSDEIRNLTNSRYVLGANTNVKWNWTINPELTTGRDTSMNAYIYSGTNVMQDGRIYMNAQASAEEGQFAVSVSENIDSYYTTPISFDSNYYRTLFLSTNSNAEEAPNDEDSYSQYVKALEYAIYCYAVDLEPAEITVTHEVNDDDEYTGEYTLQVGNFNPDGERTSVDVALDYAKYVFTELGSYVGLVDRQITKIQNWILDNIIGEDALNNNDWFTYYTSGVVALVGDPETSDPRYAGQYVGYDFSDTQSSTGVLGRDYETAVENIMEDVCELVSIGNDNGEDVTIDQRFLASNVMEYAGNMFFIQDDTNFPAPTDDSDLSDLNTLLPLEYQSVAFMFSEDTYVDGLWVALKYDAGLDGTEEGVYGDQYIDIIVDINYYNNANNERIILDSKQVRVYDGPYDLDFMYGEEGDGGDGINAPEGHCSGVMFDDLGQLLVKAFKTDIGNSVLMTDVGSVGHYVSAPYVSTTPLVIRGTTDVRKYYEIVEFGTNPEFDKDELEDGYTYTSGRFNPEMFAGADGCDYLEITYKVIKKAGDLDTNYKFYTGLAFMDTADSPYQS